MSKWTKFASLCFAAPFVAATVMAGVDFNGTDSKPVESEKKTKPAKYQITDSDSKPSNSSPNEMHVETNDSMNISRSAGLLEINKKDTPQIDSKLKSKSNNGDELNTMPRPKTVIKNKTKPLFVEGYKITSDAYGKEKATYVHGELEKTNTGVSGYLYNRKGKKTYVYGVGKPSGESDAGIHTKDNESSDYILDTR